MDTTDNNKNPWLALKTYEEEDQHKFKGRDEDIDNIMTLLAQNECVICYAASGEGKSSLINAGLCPRMKSISYLPIKIDLFSRQNDNTLNFDSIISEIINNRIENINYVFMEAYGGQETKYVSYEPEKKYQKKEETHEIPDSLWWQLRTKTIHTLAGTTYIPILIFDQFEEIFRIKWKNEFFKWLEILMKDKCPDDNIDDNLIPTRKLFKVLFSMRHEYVGELDYWCSQRTYIPQMMRNRYFLKPLTKEQSLSIIKGQEYHDENIANKTISCAGEIIDVAKKDKNNQSDEVSAIVLSLICKLLYDNWSDNSDCSINIAQYKEVIYGYYDQTMKEIGISDDARYNIEEALVSETRTKHRIPVSDNRLIKINFDSFKDKLKDKHIVKIDTTDNTEYVEFIHDRLVESIYDKHKEESKKREYDKKIKRNMFFVTLSLVILVIVSALFINAKKNEKNYLITQAKFIAAEAEKLAEKGDVYNAARLLNYLAKNNKEANNMSEFKHSIRSLDFNYDLPIRQYMDDARSFKITPDGKYIITGSKDKTVKLWSVETGNCKYIKEHSGSVYSVAVSPDGNRFISVTYSSVFLWDLEEGKCVDTINYNNYVKHVVFSPDGKYIVISIDNEIIVRSADGGSIIWYKNFNENIESAILTFDNKYIIAVGEDHIAKIWSIKDNKCIDSIKHHSSKSVSVNRDGDLLTLFGGTVKIWSINDTINDTVYMVCTDSIINNYTYDATFIHDGKILTRDNDNIIRVWGRNDVEYCCLKEYSCFGIYLPSCSDTNLFVSKIGDRLNLYMMENDKTEDIIINEKDVTKISFSPDGKYILTKSNNGVRLWSVEAGELIEEWLDRDRNIRNAGFSPNGNYIFIRDYDGVLLWSIKDRKFDKFIGFKPDTSWDKKITFSSNGKYLALATYESVKIWSIDDKKCLDTIYAEGIKSMCFNCDKDTFIMLTRDDTLRIRSINKKEWLKFIPTIGGTKDVILNPNGSNLIAFSEENGYVLLISTENGECFDTIRNDGNSIFKDYSFFSKDGEYIFIRTNNMLRMYDGKTGEWLHDMDNQYYAKINSDRKYIITSNGNGILKLWSDKGYDCLLTAKQYIKQGVGIRGMDVSSDGKYIAVITDIGVHIRRLQLQNHFEISNRWFEILGPNAELTEEEKGKYYLN